MKFLAWTACFLMTRNSATIAKRMYLVAEFATSNRGARWANAQTRRSNITHYADYYVFS